MESIEDLKSEIVQKEIILDLEKSNFERKLKNGMGEDMMNYINGNVIYKKPTNIFYRIKKFFKLWREKRAYKKFLKKEYKDTFNEIMLYMSNKTDYKNNH